MNLYDDIMNPTGDNNKVILSSKNVFNNSECIFVEYYDVINSPWYSLILNLIQTKSTDDYFNFSFDSNTTNLRTKLFEWYINRKYINPFFSVGLKPIINELLRKQDGDYETNRALFLNRFLYDAMNKHPEVFNEGGYLNFTHTLRKIISIKNLVNTIIIYSENYHDGMKKDIESLYDDNVIYKTGDLIELLSSNDIPTDTTYVFSDVNKVYALKDTNRLNGSSILISDRFGYNYDIDNNLMIDGALLQDDVFIINTFDNIHDLS